MGGSAEGSYFAEPVASATRQASVISIRRYGAADVAVFIAAAATVALVARAAGGFGVGAWAPTGAVLAVVAAALLAVGLRPGRLSVGGAAALMALGVWAVLSTQWGGIPDDAWRHLDQSLIGAAALITGCLVGASGRGRALTLGVLAGATVNAAEILLRFLTASAPHGWFYGRTLDGSLGYHNAQANICAIGICLAAAAMGRTNAALRAACGASLGVLLGVLLMTQSRAGLGVAVVAVLTVLAWARSSALVLRVVPAFIAAGLLLVPLRRLDSALVEQNRAHIQTAAQSFAACALLAAALLALAALITIPSRRLRAQLVLGIAVITIGTAAVGLMTQLRAPEPFGGRLSGALHDSNPNLVTAGSTRLVSLSLNGRRDAWRVAWDAGRSAPLLGRGEGTFTRAWVRDRRLEQLYILQPHSLPLELFSELGLIGLGLFACSLTCVIAGVVRGPERLATAGALGAVVALLGQAAVDWTWSFPALVVPVLLVAGAAARGRPRAAPAILAVVTGALLLLVAIGAFAVPWKADRAVAVARREAVQAPEVALASLDTAQEWNVWNPRVWELRGLILERAGSYGNAAADYARAAKLSRTSWLDHFRQARAAKASGDAMGYRRACAVAQAENPAERRLYESIC